MIINNEIDYLLACDTLTELVDAIEKYEEENFPIGDFGNELMEASYET